MSAIAVVTVPAVTLCVTEEKQWAESYGQQNAMGPGVYATEQQATGESMHAMQTQPQLPPQPQPYYPGIYNRATIDGPRDLMFLYALCYAGENQVYWTLVCKWCSHRQYVCLSKVAVIKL